MKTFKGELLLIITALMWGSGFVGMAKGLEHFSVIQLMAGRFTLAALLLSIIFYKKLKLFNWSILWKGMILGSILFGAFVLQTFGLEYTTASKNAFLTSINVLIVPLIAFVVYKRGFDRYEVIAAFIAIIGIGLLSLTNDFTINLGDWLSILCAVAFAFDIFYTNVFVKKEDALALTIIQFITAACLSVIGMVITQDIPTTITSEGFSILLYLAVFCTLIAYVCQNVGMQYANPTKSAVILSMEALFGTLFAVLLLGEMLTLRMMIGCIFILIAVLFAELKPKFKFK